MLGICGEVRSSQGVPRFFASGPWGWVGGEKTRGEGFCALIGQTATEWLVGRAGGETGEGRWTDTGRWSRHTGSSDSLPDCVVCVQCVFPSKAKPTALVQTPAIPRQILIFCGRWLLAPILVGNPTVVVSKNVYVQQFPSPTLTMHSAAHTNVISPTCCRLL